MALSAPKIDLPSPMSAFHRPTTVERRRSITPSPALCRNLFGRSEGPGDLLCDMTIAQQRAFQGRWACRVDVLDRCCVNHSASKSTANPRAQSNTFSSFNQTSNQANAAQSLFKNHTGRKSPRPYQWIPINEAEDLPCMLKRLALAQIRVDNLDNVASRPVCPHLNETKRPESPIPFHSGLIDDPASNNCNSRTPGHDRLPHPSLFSLTLLKEMTGTGSDEDQEIVAVSTPETDENAVGAANLPNIPCLTPPCSPSKTKERSSRPRYMLRSQCDCLRQSKLTGMFKCHTLINCCLLAGSLDVECKSAWVNSNIEILRLRETKQLLRFSHFVFQIVHNHMQYMPGFGLPCCLSITATTICVKQWFSTWSRWNF